MYCFPGWYQQLHCLGDSAIGRGECLILIQSGLFAQPGSIISLPFFPKDYLPCCVFASRLRLFSGLGRWTHSVCPFTYPPLIILTAFCFVVVSLRPFCFLSVGIQFCSSVPVCCKLCVHFLLLSVNTCTYIDLIVM